MDNSFDSTEILDEDLVQELIDMGFERSRVEQSLRLNHNDRVMSINFLLGE